MNTQAHFDYKGIVSTTYQPHLMLPYSCTTCQHQEDTRRITPHRYYIFVHPQTVNNSTLTDQLYEKIYSGKKTSDKDLFSLSWTIDEVSRMVVICTWSCLSIYDLLKDDSTDVIQVNMACWLSTLQAKCLSFFQNTNMWLHLMS